jgi:hypothetical protein
MKKKPKTRKALIAWATTLGMNELGWIHGGACACGHCCVWGTSTKAKSPGMEAPGPYCRFDGKDVSQGQKK